MSNSFGSVGSCGGRGGVIRRGIYLSVEASFFCNHLNLHTFCFLSIFDTNLYSMDNSEKIELGESKNDKPKYSPDTKLSELKFKDGYEIDWNDEFKEGADWDVLEKDNEHYGVPVRKSEPKTGEKVRARRMVKAMSNKQKD